MRILALVCCLFEQDMYESLPNDCVLKAMQQVRPGRLAPVSLLTEVEFSGSRGVCRHPRPRRCRAA